MGRHEKAQRRQPQEGRLSGADSTRETGEDGAKRKMTARRRDGGRCRSGASKQRELSMSAHVISSSSIFSSRSLLEHVSRTCCTSFSRYARSFSFGLDATGLDCECSCRFGR